MDGWHPPSLRERETRVTVRCDLAAAPRDELDDLDLPCSVLLNSEVAESVYGGGEGARNGTNSRATPDFVFFRHRDLRSDLLCRRRLGVCLVSFSESRATSIGAPPPPLPSAT